MAKQPEKKRGRGKSEDSANNAEIAARLGMRPEALRDGFAQARSRGRPRLKLDEWLIEMLASKYCTVEEIAAILGCHKRTLERNFVAVLEKGRACGRASLRRMQFKSAEGGNVTAQIWLGKQLLGQRDRQTHEVTGEDGAPISIDWLQDAVKRAGG